MDSTQFIKSKLQLSSTAIFATLRLLEEGATIPFIARYRQERTEGLDETQIYDIRRTYQQYQEIDKRREFIITAIGTQNKLTSQLKKQLLSCWNTEELEDLYTPYKSKKKTRATKARERGLEPLARQIFKQERGPVDEYARIYSKNETIAVDEACQGARDIIAEWISEDLRVRQYLRKVYQNYALIEANLIPNKGTEASKYQDYFAYSEKIKNIPSHRFLALMRGVKEGFLRCKVLPNQNRVLESLCDRILKNQSQSAKQVKMALEDAYKRLLHPSLENEILAKSKSKADDEAIEIFARNLSTLLLSAPLGERNILSIDPGFRTGCKMVALDKTGNYLAYQAIFPHPPQNRRQESLEKVKEFIHKYGLEAVAIGNGTAGRETFDWLRNTFPNLQGCIYLVNESGASIYSASSVAREEFPDLDLTIRGAISIGRRLMDPLAELIKIDPKSIGVGQYQHDVNQKKLRERLDQVVSSCVNKVGINLNTASYHLLTYVSGVGPTLAKHIVDYRHEIGGYKNRRQLLNVPKLGPKVFEQAAGFLRIKGGDQVLDNTGIHPERYELIHRIVEDHKITIKQWLAKPEWVKDINWQTYFSTDVGKPTLKHIFSELTRPGLDPRGTAAQPAFNDHIHTINDLEVGQILKGTVTNLTKFGAFVDLGIKENGLVHISEIANRFVSNPAEELQLDQIVSVKVTEIDLDRGRIHLSIKRVQHQK